MMHTPHTGQGVLVVEDDHSVRDLLATFLEGEGYTVHTAGNGQEALARLQSIVAPCLILLDLMMPVMNGWEFGERLKRSQDWSQIPVVIVSAAGDLKRQAATLGTVAHIGKPIDFGELLNVVQTFC